MKKLLLAITITLLYTSVFSQKIALIKTDFKSPIIYTDSVTISQISQNYIPIETNCFDSIHSILSYLRVFLEGNVTARSKMQSFELRACSTLFKITTVKHAYGDCYDIDMITKIYDITSKFRLADNVKLKKKNSLRILDLMNLMKNEKSLFKSDYKEMKMHQYNIEIYE